MNWHFRTIGMGTYNFRSAAKRLAREVYETGRFETSTGESEAFLKKTSPDFWKQHSNILHARTPGFGWWIWKPEYLKVCLEQLPLGDGLFYLDAGTVFSTSDSDLKYLDFLLRLGATELLIGSNSQSFAEDRYSSLRLMDLCNLDKSQRKANQFWAGFLMVQNNLIGRKFVQSWSELLCLDDHRFLIPDEKERSDNPQLIHHMYDQAVFSCLMKAKNGISISIDETCKSGLIRPLRHRYGYGFFNSSIRLRFFYHLVGFVSKMKLFMERRLIKNSLSERPKNHIPTYYLNN